MYKESDYGKNLVKFRTAAGLSQEALAEAADCSTSTISRLENGENFPHRGLFEKLNQVFEIYNYSYEDFSMEEIFHFKSAKDELLKIINAGRADILEEKIDKFAAMIDEENIEDKQYLLLAQLMYVRLCGHTVENFIDNCIEIFELSKDMPEPENISSTPLTKIEKIILQKIAEEHINTNDNELGQTMLEGILSHVASSPNSNPKYIDDCLSICHCLATCFYKQGQVEKAKICNDYILNTIAKNPAYYYFNNAIALKASIDKDALPKDQIKELEAFPISMEKISNIVANTREK